MLSHLPELRDKRGEGAEYTEYIKIKGLTGEIKIDINFPSLDGNMCLDLFDGPNDISDQIFAFPLSPSIHKYDHVFIYSGLSAE